MIRTLFHILMLCAASILSGLMLMVLAGVYTPVFDRFMAAGVLLVALGAIMDALNSLMGDE